MWAMAFKKQHLLPPRRVALNKTVFQAVDEFYNLVNAAPSTEAGDRLVRLAATYPVDVAIEALAEALCRGCGP